MSDRLSHLAAALAARQPAGVAGWRGAAPVGYGEVTARLHAWRAMLAGCGGRHYALYMEDSLEFAAALLGAWHAGKTVWLTADVLPASCDALAQRVDGFLGDFPAHLAPLQLDGTVPDPRPWPALSPLDAAADVLVVHTSGSSGAPQAIPKRLSQLSSELQVLEQMFGAQLHGGAVLATVSHQHIYGLLFKVLWPLCATRPLHAASAAYPEQLAGLLALRPSILVSSPAQLARLPAHLEWRGARAQLLAVYSSGGPLPEEAAHACVGLLGVAPVEVYGSSESGGVAWRQRRADVRHSANWLPFPNVAWRIAPDDGTLEVRSPHLASVPGEGWLALADRVAPADGGRFTLLGRADRIVKVAEKRISLDALEGALSASPLVEQARLLQDGCRRGQLAGVVVLSTQGQAQLAAGGKLAMNRALRALLAGVAEAVALPRRWRYPASLPLNAQGKTTHAALLALFGSAPQAPLAERPRQPLLRELERGPGKVLLELTVPADLLYFDGHFPNAPVLPGVAQLDWAIRYGRRYFDLPPDFRDVAALKFQQVIRPGAVVHLELQHDPVKASLQFRYLSAAGQHASGRIAFVFPQP
jgi:acyl-coenzyme A synthetase/AMP-(fatty) acid ligase/3-hydroxymyristoyl/3-hydroxydecanoyl-(acyl carrier protein) dehydratase